MLPNLENTRIAIIGLGYVGLPLAVEFGKQFPTIGFDIDPQRVSEIQQGCDRNLEVIPEDLVSAKKLLITSVLTDLADCNVYIVTVPTPIDDMKLPDLNPLEKATVSIGSLLKRGDVVIYESTVYPGATEEFCVPILEAKSELVFNQDFTCGYSPERINPGDKQNRLTTIIKVTSGSTPKTAEFVDALYRRIITAGTHKVSSIKVAEAAKAIENTQRDLNIALVNELSIIFNLLQIDTLEVLQAAETKWNFLPFRPGLVGGHCIGVDPYYLTHSAQKVGYLPQVILAGRRINEAIAGYAARTTIKKMIINRIDMSHARVGIWGLTFKENCPDTRNSKVMALIEELRSYGLEVVVEDPWVNQKLIHEEYPDLVLGLIDENNPVDALVVAVAHEQYCRRTPAEIRRVLRGERPVVADLKSLYNAEALANLGIAVWRL